MAKKGLFYSLSILLLMLLILTYSNHFHNGFHFDDSHTIEDNLFIRHLHNIPLFFKDVSTFSTLPSHQNYRPMVSTTLAIDYRLGGGLNPFYFHLSTFILYVLQCALIFLLFYKILKLSVVGKYNHFIALFGTGWYAFHTANAETINYIISRSDSLSTLGVIASLVMYMYLPNLRKWYLYLLPLMFGLLAKETAVTGFVLLFFYVLLFEKQISIADVFKSGNFKKLFQAFRIILPALIVCALFALLNLKMMSKEYVAGGSRYYYMITQPFVIFKYFITFFFPADLSADTDLFAFSTIFDNRFYLGAIFIILMMWLMFFTSSKKELRPIAFGIIWFFIALLPTSSIIPLSEVLNDHRIFFPFIGLALSCAGALGILYYKYENIIKEQLAYKVLIILFVLIVIGGNAYGVYQRNKVWNNEESLWLDVTIKSPKNGRGLMNYGLTQMSKGNYAAAQEYFEKALVYNPYYSYLYINLGILKNALNKPQEAEAYLKRAIELDPNYYGTYYYYANFLFKHNRYQEAIPLYERAIQFSPSYLYSRYDLMKIYFDTEQWEKLQVQAQQTLQFAPDDKVVLGYFKAGQERKSKLQLAEDFASSNPTAENYLNLSLQYYQEAKYEECIEACNKSLKINPSFAEAYNNICSAYNAMGKWQEAIKSCEKALKLKPEFPLAKGNLKYAKKVLESRQK